MKFVTLCAFSFLWKCVYFLDLFLMNFVFVISSQLLTVCPFLFSLPNLRIKADMPQSHTDWGSQHKLEIFTVLYADFLIQVAQELSLLTVNFTSQWALRLVYVYCQLWTHSCLSVTRGFMQCIRKMWFPKTFFNNGHKQLNKVLPTVSDIYFKQHCIVSQKSTSWLLRYQILNNTD